MSQYTSVSTRRIKKPLVEKQRESLTQLAAGLISRPLYVRYCQTLHDIPTENKDIYRFAAVAGVGLTTIERDSKRYKGDPIIIVPSSRMLSNLEDRYVNPYIKAVERKEDNLYLTAVVPQGHEHKVWRLLVAQAISEIELE